MSGIYFHIPYCRKACHYCDFHFSTNLSTRKRVLKAMVRELEMRKAYLENTTVNTIYFGGGTPSVLEAEELLALFNAIKAHYRLSESPEITFEVNPDDVTEEQVALWKSVGINRISIGIQSFQDTQLQAMNRSHSVATAHAALQLLKAGGLVNITADLMYGLLNDSLERLVQDVDTLLSYDIPHISTYGLTIEPETAYGRWNESGKITVPEEELSVAQYDYLIDVLPKKGFIHYEISNFGKPGYFSQHNSNYWKGEFYLGIGPGAHSFNGISRQYNREHNVFYAEDIEQERDGCEVEMLEIKTRLNEYLLTGIRTIWGVSLQKIRDDFGTHFEQFIEPLQGLVNEGMVEIKDDSIVLTSKGKHFSDRITRDLFLS